MTHAPSVVKTLSTGTANRSVRVSQTTRAATNCPGRKADPDGIEARTSTVSVAASTCGETKATLPSTALDDAAATEAASRPTEISTGWFGFKRSASAVGIRTAATSQCRSMILAATVVVST